MRAIAATVIASYFLLLCWGVSQSATSGELRMLAGPVSLFRGCSSTHLAIGYGEFSIFFLCVFCLTACHNKLPLYLTRYELKYKLEAQVKHRPSLTPQACASFSA